MKKLDELEHLLELEKASKDFATFIKMTKPNYEFEWFHKVMIERLQKLPFQRNQRILISMPPRCGKSELVSRRYPAWLMGLDHNHQIITTSYSAQLARLFNRDIQRILEEPIYQEIFPDTIIGGSARAKEIEEGRGINKSKRTADIFEIVDKTGFVMSVGRGGSVTGFGANTIVIDDPLKNAEEAESETILDSLWEWFDSTIYSRLEGGANMIVCNTRWAKRDLTGRLIEDMELHGGDKWEEIVFPALKSGEPTELDPRTDGESIWPNKYTVQHFETMRRRNPRNFSALYQQQPTIQGGAIIKEDWLQYYSVLPFDPSKWRSCKIVTSWDLNFKEAGGSYAVGVVIAKHENDFYLLDIYREKPSFNDLAEAILRMSKKYPTGTVLIEEKANGAAILSFLKKKVPRMVGVVPEESKEERLHAVSPIFQAKEFHLPMNHPLTKRMAAEITEFPHSENDDIPDAISMGLNHFSEMRGLTHLRAMSKWS